MDYTDEERASDDKVNAVYFLPLTGLQADRETLDRNERRYHRSDNYVDQCFLCARPLTAKAKENGWYVHLHVQLGLIPNGADIDDMSGSQGCFPVGSECAKKIPATYRFKF